MIEDYVGWGPGAKVLGSSHTGDPLDVPIIATNLVIKPVVIGYGADIGVNSVILPGIHVGAHAIVGAGAVVTETFPTMRLSQAFRRECCGRERANETDFQENLYRGVSQ